MKRDQAFLMKMQEMREQGTMMTQLEVDALSYILDTPLYTLVKFKLRNGEDRVGWQRCPHDESPYPVGNERGIYLYNGDLHFQLIIKP